MKPEYNFKFHSLIRILSLKFSVFFISSSLSFLHAQCEPPMSETCVDANIICSLQELNGYACNNPSTMASPCSPLCSQGGVGHNTSWWAFQTTGGNITLTLTVGSCTSSQGLQYGIWGSCDCTDQILCRSIPCIPPNSVSVSQITLLPSKTYYLWVDGCSGDICEFTINTSGDGGGTPSKDLSPINNNPNLFIDSICAGSNSIRFFVNPSELCSPVYFWKLNEKLLTSPLNEIFLDFPEPGEFQLCVTAYSTLTQNQTNTQCITIRVFSLGEQIGLKRYLCWEEVHPDGKKWYDQKIVSSGIYRQHFNLNNGCKFDSVVEFIVLPQLEKPEVFHISCDSTPYTDALGRAWFGCRDSFQITLPKFSKEYECDSSLLLTSAFLSIKPVWELQCSPGDRNLIIRPDFGTICSLIDSMQINYFWFKQDDPDRKILSTKDKLAVKMGENYCVELDLNVYAVNRFTSSCKSLFCYDLNKDTIFNSVSPKGPLSLCSNDIGSFKFDTSISKGSQYQWSSDPNAVFHSMNKGEAKVSWSEPGLKSICFSTFDNPNESCLFCQQVEIIKAAQTGRDFKVLGLQTRMKAAKPDFGVWKLISGPGNVSFENIRDPKTRIKVTKSGSYSFEWAALYQNCVDKDSVVIEFFTKPIDPTHLIFFTNEEETDFGKLEKRSISQKVFMFYTPTLIRSVGTSFIQTQPDLYFEKAEYFWKNTSGYNLISGRIDNSNCNPLCQIEAPVQPGLYFLILHIEGQQLVKKVIVME